MDALGLVVVSELPRTQDTLMLRLMGDGEVLKQAYVEVHHLHADAWERQIAIPVLKGFRSRALKNASGEVKEFLMSTQSTYDEWLNEVQSEARNQGLARGVREGIEAACDLLGVKITTKRRAQLDALDPAALKELLAHLRRERRWPREP